MALASSEGWLFLLRWIHFFAGVTWIGLLYYFNFVQTPFFAETEAPVRSGAIQKLVPRALWWFRYGALFTFLSGALIILHRWGQAGGAFFAGSYGWAILLGGLLGTMMFLNVWGVIWPNQQKILGLKPATDEEKNKARRVALLASRTNMMLSIPMLFFMAGGMTHKAAFGL